MLGKYYKTIQRDEATGETIFEFIPLEHCTYAKDGILTCRGMIGVFAYGMPIEIYGEFKSGLFYVSQYQITSQSENAARAMLQYLSNENLTETQENSIINQCQNDILRIASEPEILEIALKRCKQKEAIKKEILSKLKKLYSQEKFTRSLLKYGIELNKIELLIQHGINYEQFKKNPYLSCLYHSISVYQADQFAFDECNILPYSTLRLCGFLMDAVLAYQKNGHSCMKPKDILYFINARLKKSVYPECQINLALLNYCIMRSSNIVGYHILNDEIYIYNTDIWKQEEQIVFDIKRLNSNPEKILDVLDIAKDIEKIQKHIGITYNEEQKQAFHLLKNTGIKILTGPPGSGKTATLRGMIEAYQNTYPDRLVRLAATTGRASQVMTESTGKPAETINKMLNIRPFGGKKQGRTANNPVEADFLICDEISMLGTELASQLFRAVKSGALLLLVGDEDQLQSVEYGNILQDFIQSGVIEIHRLTQVMRHSGAICQNAKRINQGNIYLQEDDTFIIHRCQKDDELLNTLIQSIGKDDVQILSSVKGGTLGTYYVNQIVQKKKNKRKQLCLTYHQTNYYENDPIIMTETNYDKGYYNGDIGIIQGKDDEGIIVDFSGKILHLGKEDYHVMLLAYCITTHKSQGSSFTDVHVILPRTPDIMLTRRIIYTAVTRARRSVHIYTMQDALEYAIRNTTEKPRLSLLAKKISQQSK